MFTETKTETEQQIQIRSAVRSWRSTKFHTTQLHVLYNVLRGHDPKRGFAPIARQNKITSNSNDPWNGYNQAARHLKYLCANPTNQYTFERVKAQLTAICKSFDLTEEAVRELISKLPS